MLISLILNLLPATPSIPLIPAFHTTLMPTRQTPLTARSQHLPKHLRSNCRSICAATAEAPAQQLPKHLCSTCRSICAKPTEAPVEASVQNLPKHLSKHLCKTYRGIPPHWRLNLTKNKMKMESLLPRKLISLTCVALVAMSHAVSAQNTSAVNATAFDFLNRNICPASSGRAGTDLAFSDPSSLTIFSNPASLAFSEKELDAAVAYSLWQPDRLKTNVYDAGLTFRPYDKLGVAAAVSYGIGESYDKYTSTGVPDGTFTPKEIVAGFSLSYKPLSYISFGVNMKYASTALTQKDSHKAFAADAFALADVSGIRIAAGVRNIGGKIKSSEGSSFSLPASVSAGVAYRFVNTEQHHIEAGADADIFIDGGASASVGVEYSYRNAAFARLGYNYASDKAPVPSFASVGIGFRIRSVRIDASYILPEKESPQKNTFSAGVGIWF